MPIVNVHQAKTLLSRLLTRVEAGEDVVIARNERPLAQLVRRQHRGKRPFGALKGRTGVSDSFFDPLPEARLSAWRHRGPSFSQATPS